ncbi:MAG: hypothetical protein IJ880_01840 [Bacilli bacterium]|nr:hypothetical protein [Bacilli bacterium]
MSIEIIIAMVICIVIATAYITTLICNHENRSSWQAITYTDSSIEPKNVYICKNCFNKANINYRYCSNCGARMNDGLPFMYHSSSIDLSE